MHLRRTFRSVLLAMPFLGSAWVAAQNAAGAESASVHPQAPAVAFTITKLEIPGAPQDANSSPFAINNTGQFAGQAYFAKGDFGNRAFLFAEGKVRDLGTLGGNYSKASAISSSGLVAGTADTARTLPPSHGYAQPIEHAFLFDGTRMQDLGTLGGNLSAAVAVNAAGLVVGGSSVAEGSQHAFLYQDGQMHDLGAFGGNFSVARGVNTSGQIVGTFGTGNETEMRSQGRAFIYEHGQMRELGTLGGNISQAFAINDAGQIVGWSNTRDGSTHAFLYDHGHMQDLGALGWDASIARAINRSGEVVGAFGDGAGGVLAGYYGHAFLYRGGHLQDLNALVGEAALAAAGITTLQDATGINDQGQIVCVGVDSHGNSMAYLLTPVDATVVALPPPPVPCTLTMLGTLGGNTSEASAINNFGEVVGTSDTPVSLPPPWDSSNSSPDTFAHAFLYRAGVMQDLGTLGGVASSAAAINDAGEVVGEAELAPEPEKVVRDAAGKVIQVIPAFRGDSHAFLYRAGRMQDLGVLSEDGSGTSSAKSINPLGMVVGDSENQTFVYQSGRRREVFKSFDLKDTFAFPVGVNDHGDIVGWMGNPLESQGDWTELAFFYHPAGWFEFVGFWPEALNNAGQVVGRGSASADGSEDVNDGFHALLWTNGHIQDLGTLGWHESGANAINNSGQVVGWFGPQAGHAQEGHAFLYREGRMQDLNDLVGPAQLAAAGFKELRTAEGINDRGQIVGFGTSTDGFKRAFLLTFPSGRDLTPAANFRQP